MHLRTSITFWFKPSLARLDALMARFVWAVTTISHPPFRVSAVSATRLALSLPVNSVGHGSFLFARECANLRPDRQHLKYVRVRIQCTDAIHNEYAGGQRNTQNGGAAINDWYPPPCEIHELRIFVIQGAALPAQAFGGARLKNTNAAINARTHTASKTKRHRIGK